MQIFKYIINFYYFFSSFYLMNDFNNILNKGGVYKIIIFFLLLNSNKVSNNYKLNEMKRNEVIFNLNFIKNQIKNWSSIKIDLIRLLFM